MEKKISINRTYHEVINDRLKLWESKRSERYKEYRKKWSLNPENFILENAPLHLDIEPTSACNLKCPMCPRTVLVGEEDSSFRIETMELKMYKNIIDQAAEAGVYSVKLNWLGEPLLHKNIVEMIQYAKDKGIEDVMLNTNAVLLDEDLSKGLIDAGLDKLFFSFDSPIKEKFESIRVGANFDDTFNNIKKFMELRNSLGKDTPLTRVSMVLMDDDLTEYDGLVDLFGKIVDIVEYGECVETKNESTALEYNENFACSQLWQRMIITADGDVLVCCVDSSRDYVVGNVKKDTISSIWKNAKYNDIRKAHVEGKYNTIDMCSRCDMSSKKWDEF